jgi:hypothetical protein
MILFPDDWAPISPTLTRLVDHIKPEATIRVFAIDTGRHPVASLDRSIYESVGFPRWIVRAHLHLLVKPFALAIAAKNASRQCESIIAFDFQGALAAILLLRKFHFVSLELTQSKLTRLLLAKSALSITIQSKDRLDFIIGCNALPNIPVHFVQNAPSNNVIKTMPSFRPLHESPRLVYMGNIIKSHGISEMIALLKAWETSTLTLQGPMPESSIRLLHENAADELASGRLIYSDAFIEDIDVVPFLSKFDIGLCFYSLSGRQSQDFNYISSPSGKMFNYFAAGLPVLSSNHLGLNPVSEFNAGIQAKSLDADTLIHDAKKILDNYQIFSAGALSAANANNFTNAVAPLLKQLGLKGTICV